MSKDGARIVTNNVKKFREKKSLTRKELSIMLGFNSSYIGKFEREAHDMAFWRLIKIADALGVQVKDLF